MDPKAKRQGTYLVMLPGEQVEKELKIGAGWTGFGLRGQIADILMPKGTDPNKLIIRADGAREITNATSDEIRQIDPNSIIVVSIKD